LEAAGIAQLDVWADEIFDAPRLEALLAVRAAPDH